MKTNIRKRLLRWCPQPNSQISLKLKQTTINRLFSNRRNIVASAFFILMLAVLVPATWYVAVNFGRAQPSDEAGLWIEVNQLSQKPQSYFQLSNPDSYVVQAISNLGDWVHVGDWNNTQIYDIARQNQDLASQNGIGNFEFSNAYYGIRFRSADPGQLLTNDTIFLIIAGWFIYGVALIITTFVLTGRIHQVGKNQRLTM